QRGFQFDSRLLDKNGEIHWTLHSAMPRFDLRGAFLDYIGFVIDISERKRYEDALQIAREESEQRVIERTSQLAAANEKLAKEVAVRTQAEEKLKKAFEENQLLKDRLTLQKRYLEEEIKTGQGFEEMIGQSQALRAVLRQIER